MIVDMKKATILVRTQDADVALERLRELGLIHIQAVKSPSSEAIQAIETQVANVDRALRLIGAENATAEPAGMEQAGERVKEILALAQEKEELLRKLAEHQQHDRWFKEWGAVSWASLQALRQAGIWVRFYVADKKAFKEIAQGRVVEVVKETDKAVYLAFFSEDPAARLELREDPMPQLEVAPMRAQMAEIEARVEKIDATLRGLVASGDCLLAYRQKLAGQLEFHRVKQGMGDAGQLAYLQGFCPAAEVGKIENAAVAAGWGYVVQDPDDPRETPTLVQSSRWVGIIKPVFSFMGTLPGYDEYDISFWFLLFFSLFYGMLVGDGGYGLIFLLATFFLRRKFKNAASEPFALMYVLSGATIGWGAISGTWFGMESIFEPLPFLKSLVLQPLASIGGDQNFMMYLCFLIGAVQLSIAHALIAVRHIKSPVALSQVGWIGIVWALFFVAGNLVLGNDFPAFGMPLLAVGLGLVLLFANFQKNIVKGILITLGDLPLSVISSFSDVVSYLRLFAVGFATFIVASSFNGMAAAAGEGGVFGSLMAAVILFLGHGINIILALMAVVVHGIRLNMLEFSGHLNMQWSGKPYRPFKAPPEQ